MRRLFPILIAAVVLIIVGCSQTANDSAVTAKVKTKLAADTETSAIKIGVETNNGVVTLSGEVPTDKEKSKAEQLAKNTDGVKRVVNEIKVSPESTSASNFGEKAGEAAKNVGETISDAAILAKLKSKLIADGITGTNVD